MSPFAGKLPSRLHYLTVGRFEHIGILPFLPHAVSGPGRLSFHRSRDADMCVSCNVLFNAIFSSKLHNLMSLPNRDKSVH